MELIMEKTRELGETILASKEYQEMGMAESMMDGDEAASKLMSDYQDKRNQVQKLMSSENVDREALMIASNLFREAQDGLQGNAYISAYLKTREAFSTVISQVNQVLQFIITGQTEGDSCGSECGSCGGGCHH